MSYPEIDPARINHDLIRHQTLAQYVTARALRENLIVDYLTERMLAAQSHALEKQPDICWIMGSGERVAVEIELTPKFGRKLDDFMLKLAIALDSSKPSRNKYERASIITDSPAIARRYMDFICNAKSFNVWHKNSRGHWQSTDRHVAPPWLPDRIDVLTISTML